jgi:hypothetical protein
MRRQDAFFAAAHCHSFRAKIQALVQVYRKATGRERGN